MSEQDESPDRLRLRRLLDEFPVCWDPEDDWTSVDLENDAGVKALADRLEQAERDKAAVERVRARHVPYYTYNDGRRVDCTVLIYCDDHTCAGDEENPCAESNDGEHEVLACQECRCIVMDGDCNGCLLWPCPTARDLDGTEADQ